MDSIINGINLVIASAGLTMGIVGLMLVTLLRFLDKHTKVFFTAYFSYIFCYVLLDLLGQFSFENKTPDGALVGRILLFMESFVASILTVMTTEFILYQSGDTRWKTNRTLNIARGIWILYIIMLIVNEFTGSFYYYDITNEYHRGPYYPLLLVPLVLIMLINVLLIILRRDYLTRRQQIAFGVYALVPLISMVFQMLFYGIYAAVLGTTIAATFMMFNIVIDQQDKHFQKEDENAQLKLEILLAQIQPHFLFNSLNTVKYLCKKDPEKAEEALGEFTEYLRRNMESLNNDKPIPFDDALRHVEGYLALQKYRFGDELRVEYDFECRDFNIPTLTLQPLVENAVTYGIRKKESGEGTVIIRTRRFQDHVEVSVIDDGPGFDPGNLGKDTSRSHLGIRNVKERLLRIAGGELKIESEIGKGTEVTILLPDT